MTYVDDLHEGDDREPEPDEHEDDCPYELEDLPRMLDMLIAELREARQRIAEWESLPTREEWAVTKDASTPPSASDFQYTADAAMTLAARHGRQAWRRVVVLDPVVVRPWEPISDDAPF